MSAPRNKPTPDIELDLADQALSVLQKISAATSLTPVHRRMADFVRENMFRAATMSIDEFAGAADASAASANRFAHALGYDGYPSFRSALVRGYEANLAPVERLRSAHQSSVGAIGASGTLDEALAQIADNVESTRQSVDRATCEAVVDILLSARRVYVLGYGASAFLAGLTEHGLSPYCPDIQSLALPGGPSHAARRLSTASSQDVVLAIAFPRYAADSITLARYAAKRGVRVLAITDGPASPLMALAEIAMFVQAKRRLAANSDATVLAFIEALCDLAAHRSKHAVKAATDLTESILPWLVRDGVPTETRTTGRMQPPVRGAASEQSGGSREVDDADASGESCDAGDDNDAIERRSGR